jgi:hypothetical protein
VWRTSPVHPSNTNGTSNTSGMRSQGAQPAPDPNTHAQPAPDPNTHAQPAQHPNTHAQPAPGRYLDRGGRPPTPESCDAVSFWLMYELLFSQKLDSSTSTERLQEEERGGRGGGGGKEGRKEEEKGGRISCLDVSHGVCARPRGNDAWRAALCASSIALPPHIHIHVHVHIHVHIHARRDLRFAGSMTSMVLRQAAHS